MRLAVCTNEYATTNDVDGWTELDVTELKVWLAIVFFMGLVKVPDRKNYFVGPLEQKFVAGRMKFTRFNAITTCLHYIHTADMSPADIKAAKAHSCFYLVDDFVEDLAKNCRDHYRPGQHFDIDEQTIGFKGRHIARQYNPNKPNKWHFRVYSVNCSDTGYQMNFYLYRGILTEQRPEGVTATEYPAFRLTQPKFFHDRGHVCWQDNWFSGFGNTKLLKKRSCTTD